MATSASVGRASGSGLWHFLEHQFVRYISTWRSTVVTSLLFPVMFLLAIGVGLGSQVDDTSTLGTVDYKAFVGPGVMAGVAMLQGGAMSLWPTLSAIKWEGTYQAALATPLTAAELSTGHLVWIGFRTGVGASLYLAVLTLFGIPASPLAILAPAAAALTALAFAGPISAFTATQQKDDAFGAINRVTLTPLFLFSGAFYPLEQLPVVVEWVARVFPVSHGVALTRGLVNNSISLVDALGHAGYLATWAVLGWAAAVRTFTGRLAS